MKEMMKFNNEEMSVVIYKSMEIYDTFKKSIIKVNSERLSIEDKKYLSLLLGILNTNNQVGNVMRLLKYDYGVSVLPNLKSYPECEKVYFDNFSDLFLTNNINENSGVEDLMLFLLQNNFIQNLHCLTGSSMACIKSIIYKIKENDKNSVESLQLRKTMIS